MYSDHIFIWNYPLLKILNNVHTKYTSQLGNGPIILWSITSVFVEPILQTHSIFHIPIKFEYNLLTYQLTASQPPPSRTKNTSILYFKPISCYFPLVKIFRTFRPSMRFQLYLICFWWFSYSDCHFSLLFDIF